MRKINKTEMARQLYESGNYVSALRICRNFRIGVPEVNRRDMQIAYECMTGNESFYRSIGIDTEQIIEHSKEILRNLFAPEEFES